MLARMIVTVLVWTSYFVVLFGGTHLLAYLFGYDSNDVVGWVVLGAVCTLFTRASPACKKRGR